MAGADVAAMYAALLAFSGAVYPDRLEYVDRVLQTCHNVSWVLGAGSWVVGSWVLPNYCVYAAAKAAVLRKLRSECPAPCPLPCALPWPPPLALDPVPFALPCCLPL